MSLPIPDATLNRVLELLSDGKTLKEAAIEVGHARQSIGVRFRADPELEQRYEKAVKEGIEANLEDAFSSAKTAKDNFEVQKARLIADNAKWDAAKRYATVYGEKIDTGMMEGLNIILGIKRKQVTDETIVSDQ